MLMDSLLILGGAFVLGLVVGSFLSVVVHRLPIMMERTLRLECQEEGELSEAE